MLDVPALMIAPIVVFAACLAVAARHAGPRIVGEPIVLFLAPVAAGWWDIAQSRSSTAGIGFLFLPAFGAAVGV